MSAIPDDMDLRPRYSMKRMRDEIEKAEERGREFERQRTDDLIEEVKRVLEPFAKAADGVGAIWEDGKLIQNLAHAGGLATIGDLRAARALLSKLEER